MGRLMNKLLLLPALGGLALILNSCAGCGGCGGSGKVSLEDSGGHAAQTGQVTAQGATGIPHIGLVPTMKTLAE